MQLEHLRKYESKRIEILLEKNFPNEIIKYA